MVLRPLVVVVLCSVTLMSLLYLMQNRLLHHPRKYSMETLRSFAHQNRLELWPDSEHYLGLLSKPAGTEEPVGTVVVFHGNAGSAGDRTFYLRHLLAMNHRVILAEYPGYGARDGTLDEKSLVHDGGEIVSLAREQFGDPLYVLGESLGAGVAAAVTGLKGEHIAGVLLITPWDTLPAVAQSIFWYLPVKLLVRDRYDSMANLESFDRPVGIVVAQRDELIPPRCAIRLYDSIKGPKRLWEVAGAKHNTWYDYKDGSWWKDVFEFLAFGGGP